MKSTSAVTYRTRFWKKTLGTVSTSAQHTVVVLRLFWNKGRPSTATIVSFTTTHLLYVASMVFRGDNRCAVFREKKKSADRSGFQKRLFIRSIDSSIVHSFFSFFLSFFRYMMIAPLFTTNAVFAKQNWLIKAAFKNDRSFNRSIVRSFIRLFFLSVQNDRAVHNKHTVRYSKVSRCSHPDRRKTRPSQAQPRPSGN